MTPDALETLIADAFETELKAIQEGRAATTPDGKPAASMKERTELLKAAVEFWTAKKGGTAVEYGAKLVNGGSRG